MNKVSIIIRAYNEEKHLPKLLEGIKGQTYSNIETILVDSGSTDRSVQIAESFGAKIVHIPSSEFTFGKALNLGISRAEGELCVFASAHVYPTDNQWIENIITPFTDQTIALVYGRQIGNERTQFSEHQVFAKWFPEESTLDQKHPFCNNANTAIRKELWEKLPYDEEITGLEDLHWANQIQQKGHKIAYISTACIVHVHEETPAKVRNRYRREAIAYKRIFPGATFSFWDFLFLFVGNTFSDHVHALRKGCFWRNFWPIVQFRYNQFLGTYQGYKHKGPVTKVLKNRFYYPNKLN